MPKCQVFSGLDNVSWFFNVEVFKYTGDWAKFRMILLSSTFVCLDALKSKAVGSRLGCRDGSVGKESSCQYPH